jgi:hypothetical protein
MGNAFAGLIWFMIEKIGGLFCIEVLTIRVHKTWEMFWLAEKLIAFKKDSATVSSLV